MFVFIFTTVTNNDSSNKTEVTSTLSDCEVYSFLKQGYDLFYISKLFIICYVFKGIRPPY